MRSFARLTAPSLAAASLASLVVSSACRSGGNAKPSETNGLLADAGSANASAASALAPLPTAALALALAGNGAVPPHEGAVPVAPTYFTDVDEEESADERPADLDEEQPFHHLRTLPRGRLGAVDAVVRSDLADFCAHREQVFFAQARAAAKGRAALDVGPFDSDCECKALLVSARFVSLVCEDSTSVDLASGDASQATPDTSFAGYSYAVDSGKAERLQFADLCAPVGLCAADVARYLGHADDAAGMELTRYLANPVFALGPTSVRLLLPPALAGDSALGLSADVPYAAFGSHAKRIPW